MAEYHIKLSGDIIHAVALDIDTAVEIGMMEIKHSTPTAFGIISINELLVTMPAPVIASE